MGKKLSKNLRLGVMLLAFVGGVAATEPAAFAQTTTKKKHELPTEPPTPKRADKPPVIWNFLVALIIIGAAFGANMLPSKRGHQD
jgi:hypothetical protein